MGWIDEAVLVHVGLHKTATSWLQEFYFPRPEAGYWIVPVPSRARHPIKQIGHWLVSDDDGRLLDPADFDAARLRQLLAGYERPAGRVPVVSNERLAGHPLSNGFDRELLARRIREVFPAARVLVTVREQHGMIMSSYMQYLKYGGWHTPEGYLRPPSDTRLPTLTLNFWDYDRLADLYGAIFGEGNVLVLPQEVLRRDAAAFVGAIAAFAGAAPPGAVDNRVEANPRKPHASSYLLRRLTALGRKSSANAFMPSLLGPRAGTILANGAKLALDAVTPRLLEDRIEAGLARRVDAIVGDFYRQSNRRLAARVPFDLAALGYRM